jgi:hypothetical protein
VSVLCGWVATEEFIAYLIVKADSAVNLETAVERLSQFGRVTHRHVVNLEDLAK